MDFDALSLAIFKSSNPVNPEEFNRNYGFYYNLFVQLIEELVGTGNYLHIAHPQHIDEASLSRERIIDVRNNIMQSRFSIVEKSLISLGTTVEQVRQIVSTEMAIPDNVNDKLRRLIKISQADRLFCLYTQMITYIENM